LTTVTKRYGRVCAVADLSFTAEAGKVTALLGLNGAGKATTLRVLLGLARPTAGVAAIDGAPYADLVEPWRSVGAVLEVHTYHPWRTGRVHLTALGMTAGLAATRVDEVLLLTDLLDVADRRVAAYSFGMRQRLGLAAALLGDPTTLVLDEPTNGLDPHGTRWLRRLLRSLAGRGCTVLVSSHLLGEVSEIADDVVIIHKGQLLRQSRLADLVAAGQRLEDVFLDLTGQAP
jgi:ABC-2 type transport system ATP-binding protein